MRAWVARRREGGALLPAPEPLWEAPVPYELIVVDVTDQGKRRPSKVARLIPAGERRAIAELMAPKLVWLEGWQLALSGLEEIPDPIGRKIVAQSWVCKLSPPPFAIGFKVTNTYVSGVLRPRRVLHEAGKSGGKLAVGSRMDPILGRQTMRAELLHYEQSKFSYPPPHLIDCGLEWMSEERFELGGLLVQNAFEERPERILRDGWLVEYDIELPELTRVQKTMMKSGH
jgi:hypothetical protein